jgi:hypothetical protein
MYVKAALLTLLIVFGCKATDAQRTGVFTTRLCNTLSASDSRAFYITGEKEVYTDGRDKVMKAATQNQDLQVLQATSQEWIAGARGGGRGITYKLRVKITTDKEIAFDSIWIAGKKLAVKPVKDAGPKWDKNEVVTLAASHYTGEPGRTNREEEKVRPLADAAKAPVEYKGAALLKYKIGGAPQYAEVPDITTLPVLYGQ